MSKYMEQMADVGPDFSSMIGPGAYMLPEDLSHFIRNDQGLNPNQRNHVLQLLNTPDLGGHLLAGTAGAALALSVSKYKKMSGTSQVLMSLAGFGLGNIILNKLTPPPKHTAWDRNTGTLKVL